MEGLQPLHRRVAGIDVYRMIDDPAASVIGRGCRPARSQPRVESAEDRCPAASPHPRHSLNTARTGLASASISFSGSAISS